MASLAHAPYYGVIRGQAVMGLLRLYGLTAIVGLCRMCWAQCELVEEASDN